MFRFGKRSQANLDTICSPIQEIANEVLKTMDISCQSGERGKIEQDKLYESGASKLKYPNSAHNKNYNNDLNLGVMAGDFVPCPTY